MLWMSSTTFVPITPFRFLPRTCHFMQGSHFYVWYNVSCEKKINLVSYFESYWLFISWWQQVLCLHFSVSVLNCSCLSPVTGRRRIIIPRISPDPECLCGDGCSVYYNSSLVDRVTTLWHRACSKCMYHIPCLRFSMPHCLTKALWTSFISWKVQNYNRVHSGYSATSMRH
jgi:hypothetical protein